VQKDKAYWLRRLGFIDDIEEYHINKTYDLLTASTFSINIFAQAL
jgi:hypothetical protein